MLVVRGRAGPGRGLQAARLRRPQRSAVRLTSPALRRAGRCGLGPRLTASAAAAPPRAPWAGGAEEASPELSSVLHPQRPAQSFIPGAAPRRSRHPPSAPPPDPGSAALTQLWGGAAPRWARGGRRGSPVRAGCPRALHAPTHGAGTRGRKAAPLRPAPPPRSRGDNTGLSPGFNAQALPWQPELRARAGAASETPTGADWRGKHGPTPGSAPPAPAGTHPRLQGRLRLLREGSAGLGLGYGAASGRAAAARGSPHGLGASDPPPQGSHFVQR